MSHLQNYLTGIERQWNLPNTLTLTRALIGLTAVVWWWVNPWLSFALVLYALISDGLDGYLARTLVVTRRKAPRSREPVDYVLSQVKMSQETPLGEAFDPLADKLFTLPILWIIAFQTADIAVFPLAILTTIYDVQNTWERRRGYSEAIQGIPPAVMRKVSLLSKTKTAFLFVFILVAIHPASSMLISPFAVIGAVLVWACWRTNRKDWLSKLARPFRF